MWRKEKERNGVQKGIQIPYNKETIHIQQLPDATSHCALYFIFDLFCVENSFPYSTKIYKYPSLLVTAVSVRLDIVVINIWVNYNYFFIKIRNRNVSRSVEIL